MVCHANDELLLQYMYTTFSKVTAIMGAHTLGRNEFENSGYEGPFTIAEGAGYKLFNTQYYRNLASMSMSNLLEYRNEVRGGGRIISLLDMKILCEGINKSNLFVCFLVFFQATDRDSQVDKRWQWNLLKHRTLFPGKAKERMVK